MMFFQLCQSSLPMWLWLFLPTLFWLPEVQGNCTSPVPPLHSTLKENISKENYPVGTVLTYRCISGYEYIPGISPSVTCLNTSKWSEISSLCRGKKCPTPNIPNGQIDADADDDIRLGGNVTFSCVYGFRLVGEATLKCVLKDGKVDWNREFPVCEHIPCNRPENIPDGQFDPDPNDEYYVGSVVIYRCNRDFSLIGNSTITCKTTEDGRNGKWNLPSPECKKVKCDLPKVENGKLINLPKPSYTYNEAISFECNSGYSAVGSLHIKCGANSSWVPAIPECVKEVKCDPPKVENGKLINLPKPSYIYNEAISFECNSGYSAVGSLHIKCGANSSWVPAIPECVKGDCPRPVLPPHSSLRGGGGLEDTYPAEAVLRLQCIPGYEYIPGITPRMTCLDTSKWSDLPTLCQGMRCPIPNIEDGKIVSSNDLRLGEEVTLGCNYGFRIIGGTTRQCVLKSGKVDWNRELPVCERIPCARPPVIANGRYDPNPSDVYDAGWIVIYQCDPDYSLIGNYKITCVVAENGLDGKWDFPSPECKKVKCPRPSIPNGNVASVYQATYTYQDNLEIECNPGYTLLGSSSIQCDADSQWKPSLPVCDKIPTTSKPTKLPPPTVPSAPPIPPRPGTVSPKEDGTEGPPTTTQTTPKEEPGSGHVIGIAIGAVIAVIVLAALIYAAVRCFCLQGKANTHPASTDNYRVVSAKDVPLEPKSKD